MLLLHWPNWRKIGDIKNDTATWTATMGQFLNSEQCSTFVKADMERANCRISDEVEQEESVVGNEMEQPEWIDIIQPKPKYEDKPSEFLQDDGGADFDWSATSYECPKEANKWLENNAVEPMNEEGG